MGDERSLRGTKGFYRGRREFIPSRCKFKVTRTAHIMVKTRKLRCMSRNCGLHHTGREALEKGGQSKHTADRQLCGGLYMLICSSE